MCRRPTRKRQREGGDDDTQTRAHRTASAGKPTPCGANSYRPRRAREKSPLLSRENCGLTPKKRPTFARELRDFVPRLCAGQRNSESTERQQRACAPECERPARSPRCATSHCAAPPSRNETLGCRRATGSTTKRPSPLESRKGRSDTALNGWQLTLRQRGPGRDQDLCSNSWRFSRRLVSRNS